MTSGIDLQNAMRSKEWSKYTSLKNSWAIWTLQDAIGADIESITSVKEKTFEEAQRELIAMLEEHRTLIQKILENWK